MIQNITRRIWNKCDKWKSHINSELHLIYIASNNDRQPVIKTFTPLHYTCRHFTSFHLKLHICKVWRGCGKDWRGWATAGQLKAADKWHDIVVGQAATVAADTTRRVARWSLGGNRGHHRRNLSAWCICKRTSTNLIRYSRVISWLWFCGEDFEFLYSLLLLSHLYYTRVWTTGCRNAWILQLRCTVSYQFKSRQVKYYPNWIS
jgi:hypothetical protein